MKNLILLLPVLFLLSCTEDEPIIKNEKGEPKLISYEGYCSDCLVLINEFEHRIESDSFSGSFSPRETNCYEMFAYSDTGGVNIYHGDSLIFSESFIERDTARNGNQLTYWCYTLR